MESRSPEGLERMKVGLGGIGGTVHCRGEDIVRESIGERRRKTRMR